MTQVKRKLGPVQAALLEALREHGYWHPRCGWAWDSPSATKARFDSLVRAGHARIDPDVTINSKSCYLPVEVAHV